MLLTTIFNDSFGLFSRQLKFYCWHSKRNLDHKNRQELINLLNEQRFESLARKIKTLDKIQDREQQVGRVLFEQCLSKSSRHQLKQLIESNLVDVNVRLDNYGRTLLHRSAYNLDVELVQILIDHGVNIRLRDYSGNTALHIAIQSYRNGAVMYGNEVDVVQNLTAIIRLLLEADRVLVDERLSKRKRTRIAEETGQDDVEKSPIKSIRIDEKSSAFHPDSSREITESCGGPHINSRAQVTSHDLKPLNLEQLDRDRISNLSNLDSLKFGSKSQQCSQSQRRENLRTIDPLLLEDSSTHLVDTKNAFGKTALHICVSIVGERYIAHFVQLLIKYGADTDATNNRMETPLYCLVKRHNMLSIHHKCTAVAYLIDGGCDDLGLAISDPKSILNGDLPRDSSDRVNNDQITRRSKPSTQTFRRVPNLKHLARLHLLRSRSEMAKVYFPKIHLPKFCPSSLDLYVNKKILDQYELF